jgi:hypothetical protein
MNNTSGVAAWWAPGAGCRVPEAHAKRLQSLKFHVDIYKVRLAFAILLVVMTDITDTSRQRSQYS